MARDGRYLVAYDIEDDHERSRVGKVLAGFGFRVQKSVFVCRLTRAGLGRLERKLTTLEIGTGCVLVYRLNDSAKCLRFGDCPQADEETDYAFVA